MDLVQQIEDLIENNAPDFEISKLFKQYIAEYKEGLNQLFEASQGKDFLVRHTKQLDHIIKMMYKIILRKSFNDYIPLRNNIPIAFVALGSYGREQLCVHSDIDLMIVFEKSEGFHIEHLIEKFLYLAWDSGLKLGHRVHELSDLRSASTEDITIKTAFYESRFITGSNFLWIRTTGELNHIRYFEQKEFILAKMEEARIRRKKFPSSMQPNVKESVGSLRDAHLLFWVAHTLYGITNLKDLRETLFSETEYKDYRIALELLFRVRSALHLIANKQQDVLVLEYIPDVTNKLGFSSQRLLVTKTLHAMWTINRFTQIYAHKLSRNFMYKSSNISLLRNHKFVHKFYIIDDTVFSSFNAFELQSNQLLEFLISLEDKTYHFDPSIYKRIHAENFNKPLNKKEHSYLLKLYSRRYVHCILELFYDSGILTQMIPPFTKVMFLPQFDGYHTHPVDIHSLMCLKALENIQDPLALELYKSFTHDERTLLHITTLLHDTGKGRTQDHSLVGAKLFSAYMTEFNISPELINIGTQLIKHHIAMSRVAFREDFYHEKVLFSFISKVQNERTLKLLYVLTYADINGVSLKTYNSFNAKLLKELYYASLEVMDNKEMITEARKRRKKEDALKKIFDFTSLSRLQQKKVLSIESNLFFIKHKPQEIVNLFTQANTVKDYSFKVYCEPNLIIEIFKSIPLNLGFLLGKLNFLNIAAMDIFKLHNEIKYFKIEFSQDIEEDELGLVKEIVEDAFDMSKQIQLKKPEIKEGEIILDCEHSNTYARLSIYTKDQTGLLAYVIKTFDDEAIDITTAKVHTIKNRVRDQFLIEKHGNVCHNAEKIIDMLVKRG
ncbi:HD domain-containing protein [Sulfurimonas sp. MAG313]|nr:HD domain-containing protein [Sulfurimonas sp. MAG313]MDF1880943.1 HD domain-containing protein [Sulfurimonas sp. MAG313]